MGIFNREEDYNITSTPAEVIEKQKEEKKENAYEFEENEANFGPLLKFIQDDDITDIDWNGKDLWLTTTTNERTKVKDIEIDEAFIRRFAQRISNLNKSQFNKKEPVLEAETEDLRISVIHNSRAVTGYSCCIRKTPPIARITARYALETNYCNEKILHLLANCIKAHLNIIVCGEPKHGKTELAKYLSTFIPDEERAYFIEDVLEWHYPELKPNADCVVVKVDEDFSYVDAIKTALKQNPRWMNITEARSDEVQYLIQGYSTGISGIATLHTNDVRKVPNRMVNMVTESIDKERFENNVYEFVDCAVLVSIKIDSEGRRYREISQIGFFINDEKNGNYCWLCYSNGKFVLDYLPESILEKFKAANIQNPFFNESIKEELEEEGYDSTYQHDENDNTDEKTDEKLDEDTKEEADEETEETDEDTEISDELRSVIFGGFDV